MMYVFWVLAGMTCCFSIQASEMTGWLYAFLVYTEIGFAVGAQTSTHVLSTVNRTQKTT